MELNEIIAENLKRLRTERGLSLGRLAELSGVSKVMLSQVEKGESSPTINTLWKIATGLQVPYTQLIDIQATKPFLCQKLRAHWWTTARDTVCIITIARKAVGILSSSTVNWTQALLLLQKDTAPIPGNLFW